MEIERVPVAYETIIKLTDKEMLMLKDGMGHLGIAWIDSPDTREFLYNLRGVLDSAS